ncbi:Insect cuticle protein [Popillia japonica]|uniref:Insect cuticle protein n=1 Tax=Popillia japonica TaxID=7064 RepID=A0AAW1LAA5_POPJA
MIKTILIVYCVVELAIADVDNTDQLKSGSPGSPAKAPLPHPPVAIILKQVNNFNPDGSYEYSYETSDGIAVEESGRPSTTSQEQPIIVSGSFKYVSPEGSPISVQYVADENGFQPQGSHLPVA